MSADFTPDVQREATLAEIIADRRYSDAFVGIVVRTRAATGYHVVREGQAVVDGRGYEVAGRMTVTDGKIDHPPDDGSKRTVSAYWLRPLPELPPVVDEMTTTTTQIPEASE